MSSAGNFSLSSTIFSMEEEPTKEQICCTYMSKPKQVAVHWWQAQNHKPTLFKNSHGLRWKERKGNKALSIPSLPDLGFYLITEEAWFPWLDWGGTLVLTGKGALNLEPMTTVLSVSLAGTTCPSHPKDADMMLWLKGPWKSYLASRSPGAGVPSSRLLHETTAS